MLVERVGVEPADVRKPLAGGGRPVGVVAGVGVVVDLPVELRVEPAGRVVERGEGALAVARRGSRITGVSCGRGGRFSLLASII